MRFDAYAGTIREHEFDYVAQALGASMGATLSKGDARRRYGEVVDLDLNGHLAAWVGFDRGNGSVYFEGKGESSPALAKAVRVHFPDHTVARADACEDYEGEGVFDSLVAITRQHKGPRVEGGFVRLPDDAEKGRTWAAGVRGAVAYQRIYEAGKMKERAHYGRPLWVRAEIEVRPHTPEHKRLAAHSDPLVLWGFAAWSWRVAQALTQIEIPRVEVAGREYSHDKTVRYVARTFRRMFETMCAEGRDWACVGREFEAIWQGDDEAAESMRQALKRSPVA